MHNDFMNLSCQELSEKQVLRRTVYKCLSCRVYPIGADKWIKKEEWRGYVTPKLHDFDSEEHAAAEPGIDLAVTKSCCKAVNCGEAQIR